MEISGSSARQTRNRDHISIDIRHGDHLVASIRRKMETISSPAECTQSFAKLAFHFFKYMIPGDPQIHQQKFSEEGNHILDLICHCLLPTYPGVKGTNSDQKHFRCATGLQAAGIRIKGSRTKNLLDIKFARGVLEIPHVIIHQYTESLFRNLIALEHSSSDGVQHITSYVFLMKSLVGSDKDVKLLQKKDILTNYDVTEKEVATLFEKLCEGVDLNESCYGGLFDQVKGHKSTWTTWHLWNLIFRTDLCSSPFLSNLAIYHLMKMLTK
ncbi:hypothetical protein OIU74_018434 [Salix koriyanagi]|uniref:Uncharacterized protein n=1 Tax=Salix koriyanagi TaxID=2511006 RepID=A0A9Q0WRR6_9ROSI|nr:hypothetical protein OIU74_018434 [Salix koriyanagi]